jgi:hypothetical protein
VVEVEAAIDESEDDWLEEYPKPSIWVGGFTAGGSKAPEGPGAGAGAGAAIEAMLAILYICVLFVLGNADWLNGETVNVKMVAEVKTCE